MNTSINTSMDTSTFVKESRKLMRMTQAQFGSLVGKSRLAITCYETGRSIPPGDVILKIIELRFPDLCLFDQHISKENKTQGIAE